MSGYRIVKESWAELSQIFFKEIIEHLKKTVSVWSVKEDPVDDVIFVVIKRW